MIAGGCCMNIDANDTTELLGFPDFKVTSIENKETMVIFYGECPLFPQCPDCKTFSTSRRRGKEKHIRHLDILGKKCYLVFWHHNYYCQRCGSNFLPPLSFLTVTKHHTDAYLDYLSQIAKGSSLAYTSVILKEPYTNVERLYYLYLTQKDDIKPNWQAKHIGLDEIAMKKGHKNYLLIIYDLDKGIVLDVLKDRKKATLKKYLNELPLETKNMISSGCIDMWRHYRECLRENLPEATIIIDRFHVSKELGKAVDKTRRELQNQGKFAQLSGEERKKLYWAVRYSEETLNKKPKYKKILKKAMKICPELKAVIQLKRNFKKIFDYKRANVARRHLSSWLRRATRSKIAALTKFLKTFRNWRKWIVNFLPFRYTNAAAEGLNNKIKLVKRLGFGFKSVKNFRLRLLHTCGNLD